MAMTVTTAPARSAVTTLDTRDFSEFRIAISESFVPLSVTSAAGETFWSSMRACSVDDVHVYRIGAAQHTVERTPELIARSDRSYFKLSLLLSGSGLLVQDDREAVLEPGDFSIYDTQRPYSLLFEGDFRTAVLMFPHELIDLAPEMVAELTAVRIRGDDGIGGVVAPFLRRIATSLDLLAGPEGTRLAHSAIDLVSTALASALSVGVAERTPNRALVRHILAYIEEHLADPGLCPDQVAAAHFISKRHLQALLHDEGLSVSGWIRSRRLEHCRRDLLDPVHASRPVAAVGARWGFIDAAHFSRTFKAAYGQSPRSLRMSYLGST